MLFTTSPADGCGEFINMTTVQSKSFRTQQAATYQSFEECHWTVVTSPGKIIKFTINSMDIKNSTIFNQSISINQSDKCNGDYLEVSLHSCLISISKNNSSILMRNVISRITDNKIIQNKKYTVSCHSPTYNID